MLNLSSQPRRGPLNRSVSIRFSEKQSPASAAVKTGLYNSQRHDNRPSGESNSGDAASAARGYTVQSPPNYWAASGLVDIVADFLGAADWVLALLDPWAGLHDLFQWLRPAPRPPLESLQVLAAALLEDHAHCQALLTAAPAQPLSRAQRADLLYLHQRMTWMLRTYLA